MDPELLRLVSRALQEASGRGTSFLSASDWIVSRIRSQYPKASVADIRRAIEEVGELPKKSKKPNGRGPG